MERKAFYALAIFFVISGSLAPLSFSRGLIAPNDPLISRQRYLEQIGVQEAWKMTTGSSATVVAVLDSGLDMNHPDIQDALWTNSGEIPGDGIDNDGNGYIDDIRGWDFINDIPDPNPKFGGDFLYAGIHHGTLIAGIIAARGNNGLGIAGISWKSRIMPLRVLTNQGEGNVFDVVRAIDYAIEKKATIINLSFLGMEESGYLRGAIRRALDAGIVVVAAAGNNEAGKKGFNLDASPVFPACFNNSLEGVIAVGSVDALGQKTPFSNYGTCIDVVAPGQDLYATQAVNYERFGFDRFYGGGWSGTSLSTAMVSGALALVLSVNPKLTPTEVSELLSKHCDTIDALNPSFVGKLGCGQLNVEKLVTAAVKSVPLTKISQRASAVIGIAQSDGKGSVRFFSSSSGKPTAAPVQKWKGGAAPARISADLNNDGNNEIITAPVKGKGALNIFSANGALLASVFPYGEQYGNGISFAVADLNGNGELEIVTVPRARAPAHVMIFNGAGKKVGTFFASPKNARTGFTLTIIP